MIEKKLNLDLITKIKNDPDFYKGKKSVNDYVKSNSFRNKLSQEDISHLEDYEEGFSRLRLMYEEIEKLGINTQEIQDFSKLSADEYKKIIPILLDWIRKQKSYPFKEGLVRQLSIPLAKKQAYRMFIDEFIKTKDDGDGLRHLYKWAIGNGLEVFAEDDIVDELIPLVIDKKHASARQMIVLGLGKMKKAENKEKVTKILINLLNDEDVAGHAIEALGKLKVKKARPFIEKFLTHKKTWWRNAAKNAIKKLTTSN